MGSKATPGGENEDGTKTAGRRKKANKTKKQGEGGMKKHTDCRKPAPL